MASVKTRIKQKHDTTEHWNTANTNGFKPLEGEIIVYSDVNRIKIGDGSNTVSNVPFLDANCVHLTGDEEIGGNKTFIQPITIKGGTGNSNVSISATDSDLGKAGQINWNDGNGNSGVVYVPQGSEDTLAKCYKIPGKHFQSFAIGDDLSGQTLYFNDQAVWGTYFQAQYTILSSSGGYSISVGGPPNINLGKNGTHVATFYNYNSKTWLESYTLPSDFGTVDALDSKGGSIKPSIWYTLGLGPAEEYTNVDVKNVYDDIKTVENQCKLLDSSKAPRDHASPGELYGLGTSQEYGHVKLVTGDLNGKTASNGYAASQSHTHGNYVTTNSAQEISGKKTFTANTTFSKAILVGNTPTAGTAGQVLRSQGLDKTPTWMDADLDTVTNVNYSSTDGATIRYYNDVNLNLPVVPGNGISIGTTTDNKHLEVKVGNTIDVNDGLSITYGTDMKYVSFGGGRLDLDGWGDTWITIDDKSDTTYSNQELGDKIQAEGFAVSSSGEVTVWTPINAYYEIKGVSTSSTSGTLPNDTSWNYLQNRPQNLRILFNKEFYNLVDKEHTTGTLVYSHVSKNINSRLVVKTITITISTRAWVLTEVNTAPANMMTTNTEQTISVWKSFTGATITNLLVGTNLQLGGGGGFGTYGQALVSGGSSTAVNKWKTITAAENITVKYSVGSATNTTYNNGGYGTGTSITFTGYKISDDTSSGYLHIYTTKFTSSVTAGKWVRFQGWSSSETILSVVATPNKNTTSGYGPRLISYINGTNVYVAADDDNATSGFSMIVITKE